MGLERTLCPQARVRLAGPPRLPRRWAGARSGRRAQRGEATRRPFDKGTYPFDEPRRVAGDVSEAGGGFDLAHVVLGRGAGPKSAGSGAGVAQIGIVCWSASVRWRYFET